MGLTRRPHRGPNFGPEILAQIWWRVRVTALYAIPHQFHWLPTRFGRRGPNRGWNAILGHVSRFLGVAAQINLRRGRARWGVVSLRGVNSAGLEPKWTVR